VDKEKALISQSFCSSLVLTGPLHGGGGGNRTRVQETYKNNVYERSHLVLVKFGSWRQVDPFHFSYTS